MTMDYMSENAANAAFEFLQESEKAFAQAAANRVQLEEGRKSILATIASGFNDGSEAERDRRARATKDYQDFLQGLAEAVRAHELLRAQRTRAFATIECYRTAESSRRQMVSKVL